MNRKQKGEKIPPDQITQITSTCYKVNSQSSAKRYSVLLTELGWFCSCKDHQFKNIDCKHIHAIKKSMQYKKSFKIKPKIKSKIVLEQISIDRCVYCNSKNFIKSGIRANKSCKIQRYFCKNCKKYFSDNLGFGKMRFSSSIITCSLESYFAGKSLRSIQNGLKQQGNKVSYVTIYDWIKKYIKLMDDYLQTITPQVGDKWHADEVWFKVNGDKKYLFAVMDSETRFWLTLQAADSKHKQNVQKLLKMAKERAKKISKIFVTDSLPSYHSAFKKEFLSVDSNVEHISDIHIRNQFKNNNVQERFNGEFRDREKTFRGLKKDDSPAIVGIQIYHNYVRPHMGLNNDTPAFSAGIEIRGNDKWLTIIQNAEKLTK